jgi:hypothetical protein
VLMQAIFSQLRWPGLGEVAPWGLNSQRGSPPIRARKGRGPTKQVRATLVFR